MPHLAHEKPDTVAAQAGWYVLEVQPPPASISDAAELEVLKHPIIVWWVQHLRDDSRGRDADSNPWHVGPLVYPLTYDGEVHHDAYILHPDGRVHTYSIDFENEADFRSWYIDEKVVREF